MFKSETQATERHLRVKLLLAFEFIIGGFFCGGAFSRESSFPYYSPRKCNTAGAPFCDSNMPAPTNWRGVVFQLSQGYPKFLPLDLQPWRSFDPRTQPGNYMRAVLQYFYEGQIKNNYDLSFRPQSNSIRQWYHAPWQDFGMNGREFVHGLTRERTSEPFELHPNQQRYWQNYAVGLYNAAGGYTIGRVWKDSTMPDATKGVFPEGTVAAKLLFTTAPIREVPYLSGAPEWTAYVYANPNNPRPNLGDPRVLTKLRLLQIDIAVKDSRASATSGWVFGTFVYGGGLASRAGQGWGNVFPVGIMWGNDPAFTGPGVLKETLINSSVSMPHYGWQGRLNGPVDNKISSCISCHSTAQDPPAPMVPIPGADVRLWFRNIRTGESFDGKGQPLDYSLALSTGIANFKTAAQLAAPPTQSSSINYRKLKAMDPRPPREGGLTH